MAFQLLGDLLGFQRKQSLKTSSSLLKRERGFLSKGSRAETAPLPCENHARKMRTFFTRRLEPKTRSSYHIYLFGGVVWQPQANAWWSEKEQRIEYTQAHDLGGIAMRYLDRPESLFPWKIPQLLENASSAIDPAVARTWHDLIRDSTMLVSRKVL